MSLVWANKGFVLDQYSHFRLWLELLYKVYTTLVQIDFSIQIFINDTNDAWPPLLVSLIII